MNPFTIDTLPEFKQAFPSYTKFKNNVTFLNLFMRMYNICLNLFEYENLPPTCDVEYLESALFWFGRAIFVNDENYGLLSLRVVENGKRNIYNRAINYRAIGFNGYNKAVTLNEGNGLWGKNAVLVKNNYMKYPTFNILLEYICDITEVKRAMMVNVNATRTPFVFSGPKQVMKSLKQMFKQMEDNEPALFVNDDYDSESINLVNNTQAFIGNDLLSLKHDLLGEMLGVLGIKYVNTEKKERLITDEAKSTEMFNDLSINTMLDQRKMAIEQVNKLFGTNIKVKLKIEQADYDVNPMEEKEDNDNDNE